MSFLLSMILNVFDEKKPRTKKYVCAVHGHVAGLAMEINNGKDYDYSRFIMCPICFGEFLQSKFPVTEEVDGNQS